METQFSNCKTRWVILLLIINTAWLLALTVGGASRNVPAKESLKELRVHSLTVVDKDGYERIRLEAVEGGYANLFFYDLKGETLVELSADANRGYSEIQLIRQASGTGYPNQYPNIGMKNRVAGPEIWIHDEYDRLMIIDATRLKTQDLCLEKAKRAYKKSKQK